MLDTPSPAARTSARADAQRDTNPSAIALPLPDHDMNASVPSLATGTPATPRTTALAIRNSPLSPNVRLDSQRLPITSPTRLPVEPGYRFVSAPVQQGPVAGYQDDYTEDPRDWRATLGEVHPSLARHLTRA